MARTCDSQGNSKIERHEIEGSRRVIFRGLKIDLALQAVELADGSRADREVVVHRGAVALVPMVDEEHVCLIKNHRYAVGKTLLEVPAGTIDPGETPAQTAERELAEETGYSRGSDSAKSASGTSRRAS